MKYLQLARMLKELKLKPIKPYSRSNLNKPKLQTKEKCIASASIKRMDLQLAAN
jgi:hypothetical protein